MRNFISRLLAWLGIEVRRTVDGVVTEFKKIEQRLEAALNFHRNSAANAALAAQAHTDEAAKADRILTKVKALTE